MGGGGGGGGVPASLRTAVWIEIEMKGCVLVILVLWTRVRSAWVDWLSEPYVGFFFQGAGREWV